MGMIRQVALCTMQRLKRRQSVGFDSLSTINQLMSAIHCLAPDREDRSFPTDARVQQVGMKKVVRKSGGDLIHTALCLTCSENKCGTCEFAPGAQDRR